MPLKAGRLIASASTKLIIATARQQHEGRPNEQDFDDGRHARDPLFVSFPMVPSRKAPRRGRRNPPCHRRWNNTIYTRQAKTWRHARRWPAGGRHLSSRPAAVGLGSSSKSGWHGFRQRAGRVPLAHAKKDKKGALPNHYQRLALGVWGSESPSARTVICPRSV
jgi:hypothetical protein